MTNIFGILIALAALIISIFFLIGAVQIIKNLKGRERRNKFNSTNPLASPKKEKELVAH